MISLWDILCVSTTVAPTRISACTIRPCCLHQRAAIVDQPFSLRLGRTASADAIAKLVKKAWGFSGLYKNVDHRDKTAARQSVSSYFGRGNGQYYRAHHGEILLSPKQQKDILQIVAQYGPLDGIKFEHYKVDWDFE